MPALVDHFDYDGDGDLDFDDVRHAAKVSWNNFWDFALRDSVVEVALGLIFAAAFTAVANSLVSDILLPIISLLPFISRNIEEKFLLLRHGPSAQHQIYNTTEQALADGAVIWMYGSFVDKVIRFILIALSLFIIGKIYGYLADDNVIKKQVRCKYCRKFIPEKAKRCMNCTSWQDGREDSGH